MLWAAWVCVQMRLPPTDACEKMTLPISHPRSAIGPAIRSNIRAPLFLGFAAEKSTPTRPRFSPRSYSCRRGRPTRAPMARLPHRSRFDPAQEFGDGVQGDLDGPGWPG